MPLHPWQQLVLNDWLALDDEGKLLNYMCVLPAPRQNGKGFILDARETWGLVHRGEWVMHTAQEFATAKKGFDRLREKFGEKKNDPNARYPELNRLVKRYTVSSNQMILDLTNGGHIEFRTRGTSGDVARGGTFDLVVVDEAQSYTEQQDAAIAPLNSAAPKGSPQTILTGTVPDPAQAYKGEVFTRVRKALVDQPEDGSCLHEWGAEEVGDVADVERWYRHNPSLGYQLLETALAKDSKTMSPEAFAREHLGWWPPTAQELSHPIRPEDWEACKTDEPPEGGVTVYAVKFSGDGLIGTLASCVKPAEGDPFVFVVDSRSMNGGLGWFVDNIVKRQNKVAQVVVDGAANAQALADRLVQAGVPAKKVAKVGAAEACAAFSGFSNAVKERQVAHWGQPALDVAATGCVRRAIGSLGGWGFQSLDDADATLVEACALAWRGAVRNKRKIGRKAVVF